VKFPQIKLSTLIVLNILAAGILWLNVKEAVLARNELIMPLGWPNDAVFIYQEKWHQTRASEGFSPEWGYAMWEGVACNIVLALSALGAAFLLLERKSLRWTKPARNTWWILAAVLVVLVALNMINRIFEGAPANGFPFMSYSFILWRLSNEDHGLIEGWHPTNLIANICIAAWTLLATYAFCQKLFAKNSKGAPASLPAKKEAQSAT
jgi:hypothetical protein